MEQRFNEQAFTPEEVKAGMVEDLVKYLLNSDIKAKEVSSYEDGGSYKNINITSDGYCVIVQWIDVYYYDNESDKFEFVGYDETVVKTSEIKTKEDSEVIK